MSKISSIKDIQHIIYINLEHRTDRKEMCENEIKKMGFICYPIRFNAIYHTVGAVGCSKSHIECLEMAKREGWTHVLICEDDMWCTDSNVFTDSLNKFLSSDLQWDVLMLGGCNRNIPNNILEYAFRTTSASSAVAYLVNEIYYDTLLNNFKDGVPQLERNPLSHYYNAIDRYWNRLQERDNWYLLYPLTVTQYPGYSDIGNARSDNSQYLLNLITPE